MLKTIRRLRYIILGLFAIEAIFVILVGGGYIYDWFNLKNVLTLPMILLAGTIIVVLDALMILFGLFVVQRKHSLSELTSAKIIGSDVKEAYDFGMIGLVVVDKDFQVIWTSELFVTRKINILDQNILEWQHSLEKLVDNAEDEDGDENLVVKVEINSRNYAVKYLSDADLFIFKDISENEYLFQTNLNQSPVVGIMMIDNYTDLSVNREINNPVTAMATSAIFEYGHKFDFLVRRYRDDAFLLIGNYKSFKKVLEDKFSILDKVREMESDQDSTLTLSAGFAYNFPDFTKLDEMAINAIDLAMSRGGDQVVVSKYGSEHQYFGGASVASEKRNKVKVRLTSDSLAAIVKNSSNVIIMGHAMADLDAIGASLGLKVLCDYIKRKDAEVSNKKFIEAKIVYDSKNVEKKTKGALLNSFSKDEMENIFVSPQELASERVSNSLIKTNTLLIIADVSRPAYVMYPPLLDKISSIAVIDHHRRAEDFITDPIFQYIETSSSSTSELVTELCEYGNFPYIDIPEKYATLMLAGIFLDTNYFRNNTTGMRTFEACMILKDYGADNGKADDFLKDEYEEYALVTKIMATLKTPFYGVVVAKGDAKDIIDAATIAKVANQCIQIKGVDAAFVIGRTGEKEIRISGRSDGSVNVQLLLEKLGGGGHQAASAVALNDITVDKAEEQLIQVLSLYLNDSRIKEN